MNTAAKGKSQERKWISSNCSTKPYHKNFNVIIMYTQQNNKRRLCGERDEIINLIVSECSKLAQEYKTRHNKMGNVIHWDCAKGWILTVFPNGIYTNQNLPKKMKHKILRDFETQIDYLIPPRRLALVLMDKKKEDLSFTWFCCSSRPQSKNERKWKDKQILRPCQKSEKNCGILFTNPSARVGYDTRSIFKRSLTGLNSEFPSPRLVAKPRLKNLVCPTIYP